MSSSSRLRVAFMGASRLGFRCLQAMHALPECEIVGLITNEKFFKISYRPSGVRNVLHADLTEFASRNGIPVWILKDKMTDPTLLSAVSAWRPTLFVVVGWYHMVPKALRGVAPAIGLHASLLPDYSGGAPLVWAIINGETRTGITLFYMDDGVDSGDIIGQAQEIILLNDTIASLYGRIEEAGLRLLVDHVPQIARGTITSRKQDHARRQIMPQRGPEDGRINWSWPALKLYNFIRAQSMPYPGAFAFFNHEKIFFWTAKLYDFHPPGVASRRLRGGEVLATVTEGPLQGLLVASSGGDTPLLISSMSADDEEDPVPAIIFAKAHGIIPGQAAFF